MAAPANSRSTGSSPGSSKALKAVALAAGFLALAFLVLAMGAVGSLNDPWFGSAMRGLFVFSLLMVAFFGTVAVLVATRGAGPRTERTRQQWTPPAQDGQAGNDRGLAVTVLVVVAFILAAAAIMRLT
jgi:hypothetical protein